MREKRADLPAREIRPERYKVCDQFTLDFDSTSSFFRALTLRERPKRLMKPSASW
jgi:hypothetical protein